MMQSTLYLGDCTDLLTAIEPASVDLVFCDPPYPEIKRPYGRMTEAAWMDMIQEVVRQSRRILRPSGSAVFVLQPNSERVGKLRPWLYEFQAWCCEEWNIVQDAYWWNTTALTNGVCSPRERGLMRSSVKICLWLGEPSCYRNQGQVLWSESEHNIAERAGRRWARIESPSGNGVNKQKAASVPLERGGSIPYNILPCPNNDPRHDAYSGHSAGTPQALSDWWVRYLCPPGGVVGDWFMGSGTTGLSAAKYGLAFVGIERDPGYFATAKRRLEQAPAGDSDD